jgi:hypothetical protein
MSKIVKVILIDHRYEPIDLDSVSVFRWSITFDQWYQLSKFEEVYGLIIWLLLVIKLSIILNYVAPNELCANFLLPYAIGLQLKLLISSENKKMLQLRFLFQELIPTVAVLLLLHSSSRECYQNQVRVLEHSLLVRSVV